MKDLIKQMTDIETSSKEQLNEAASLTVNAETGAEIADMISAMQGNAGMGKPVAGDMPMPMRHDIDKFRAAVDDDPSIPGRDDVDGDQDLQAGLLGTLAGGALGAGLGAATGATGALSGVGAGLGAKAGSGIASALGKGAAGKLAGGIAGKAAGSAIGAALPAAAGAHIGDKMTDKEEDVDEITKAQEKLPPKLVKAIKDKEAKDGDVDEWANSAPGEEASDRGDMGDYEDNIRDGDDLHAKKPRKAIRTVNPALENIKETLYKALSEKKAKPDFLDMDKDGDKKEPMKKAIKDKKAKKESVKEAEEKMPSKAAVMKCCKDGMSVAEICKKYPDCDQDKLKKMCKDCKDEMKESVEEGAFKKAGDKGDGSAKFDEMGCKKEMMKLNQSGCAKHEMYQKVGEKYGCSKANFEKLYASHCG